MNLRDCVWVSLPNHHEDHIAGKGDNSLQHYNLVHKFIPLLQAMTIPAAKAAVDKECEKLEKISAWNLTKVKSKKQVIDEVKMKDAHNLFKIPKSECPDIWIRLPRHKWPKSWSSMEDPVVPLEQNLYGHPLAGLLWERQLEKILLEAWLGENSKLRMSLCTS